MLIDELRDEETNAMCQAWHALSPTEKRAVIKKANRLRAMAQAASPFNSEQLETWRLHSRSLAYQISTEWDDWIGAEPAIEIGILEKLRTSPKIKAWESAYRVIQSGLNDLHISANSEMRTLFSNFLEGLSGTADMVEGLSGTTGVGTAHDSVVLHLVTPEVEKAIIRRASRRNGQKPHVNHAHAERKLKKLWAKMQAEGTSKTKAAPLIAKEIGLSEATVRKKLQGM
jgi:hypothetical protein